MIFAVILFRNVEACDCRDGNRLGVMAQLRDLISGANLALSLNRQIKPRAPAREKPLHHIVRSEADPELVTGKSRLADDDLCRAYGKSVSDINRVFTKALDREVLTKCTHGKRMLGHLGFPVLIVLDGITIDSFVLAAVYSEVRLPVPIEVQPSQRHSTFYWFLVD